MRSLPRCARPATVRGGTKGSAQGSPRALPHAELPAPSDPAPLLRWLPSPVSPASPVSPSAVSRRWDSRVPVPCPALPQGQVRLVLPDLVSTDGSEMRLRESRTCSNPTEPAAFLLPSFLLPSLGPLAALQGSRCISRGASGMGWRIPCPSCSQASFPRQSTQSQTCLASGGQTLPQPGHASHTHRAALSLISCSIHGDPGLPFPAKGGSPVPPAMGRPCFMESQNGLCEKGP